MRTLSPLAIPVFTKNSNLTSLSTVELAVGKTKLLPLKAKQSITFLFPVVALDAAFNGVAGHGIAALAPESGIYIPLGADKQMLEPSLFANVPGEQSFGTSPPALTVAVPGGVFRHEVFP